MQTSADLFILRTLTDTVLIGPRAAFGRGRRHALQSEDALLLRLTRARLDPGAMLRLRRAVERWRGGEGFSYTGDAALIARVVADARRGRLAAWVVPNGEVRDLRQPDIERAEGRLFQGMAVRSPTASPSVAATRDQGAARIAAHTPTAHLPAALSDPRIGATPPPRPSRLDVAGMTIEARLAEILRRATRSERLTAEMVARLEAMIAPAEIARTVAVLAIWAGSHALGIGFFVDLVLLASGAYFLGWAVIEAARNLRKFIEVAVAARTEADLDIAADLLASVIVTAGIRVLQAAIRRGSTRLAPASAKRGATFDRVDEERPSGMGSGSGIPMGRERPQKNPPARDATGFRGSKNFELKNAEYQRVRNAPETVNGTRYSGHALDQMQNRGIMPSVVENTIAEGRPFKTRGATEGFYDPVNDIRVIRSSETQQIVTVIRGKPKP